MPAARSRFGPVLLTLILIAAAAFWAALDVAARPAPPAAPPPPARPVTDLGPSRVTSKSDAQTGKIAQAVRDQIQAASSPDSELPIIVVSSGAFDAAVLSEALARRPNSTGLTFTSGRVKAGYIPALAAQAGVVTILSGAAPPPPPMPGFETDTLKLRPDQRGESRIPPLPPSKRTRSAPPLSPASAAGAGPESWHAIDVQNVRPAWEAGVRGDGVTVAVIDSGVDFGHPDLAGTTARVEDPASPYYGWPLAFDPHSLWLYANGIVGNYDNAIYAWGSWYMDTSTRVSGPTAQFETVVADPYGLYRTPHTYTLPGNSQSGVYHMGILPDEHLAFDIFGEYVAAVLVDAHVAGQYDTLYVDLNHNLDFRDDAPQSKGHEVANLDRTGDGIADLSAGMLYFIADGHTPIPASDWMYGVLPPGNGDLVALMGSYDYAEHHGTGCASSVVAQGIVDGPSPLRPTWKPAGVGGMVQGTAPHAKLLAIGNVYRDGQAIYSAYDFITYGLDGRPGTGDEPQVASMSYGYSGGSDNGWDFQSRYLTLMAQAAPNLLMLAATGNGGPGYGTITPPASSNSVVAVGAATQYGENTTFDPISSTAEITWGDVQPWSNRGPSHLGKPGPDVVSVGAWGTADTPINTITNGNTSYRLWGGTSMATPVTAGIAALIYQAYRSTHGQWPSRDQARSLLMSSATDLGYGPFVQGAGMANGGRAADLARGVAGLVVSPPSWIPGQQYQGAGGTVAPGSTTTTTFTLDNPTDNPITASTSSDALVEVNHFEWTQQLDTNRESDPDFIRPDYLANITPYLASDADLLKVTAVISYSQFSASAPNSNFVFWNNAAILLAYDWRDKNSDGRAWTDANLNGAVNSGEYQTGELNRLTYAYPKHTTWELSIANPRARIHDGLFIGLQHYIRDDDLPQTSVRLRVTVYKHAAWRLGSVNPVNVTVPAHSSRLVTASVQVPVNTPPGAQEGAIRIRYGNTVVQVPVALHVAAQGLPAQLGGTPPNGHPYDAGYTNGSIDWGWRPEAGEWRNFYINNPTTPGPNTYFWAGATWPTYPTDKDLIVLGNAPWDYFSNAAPQVFGPTGMWWLGSTYSQYLFGGAWQWGTLTGGPEDWTYGRLNRPGLHELVLHDTFYSGASYTEPYTATLGSVTLDRSAIEIHSNNLRDQAVLTFTTAMTLPGLTANAYGLSQRTRLTDIPILSEHTWFHEFTLSNTASIAISTDSNDPFDIYLFIDKWNGSRWVWVATSAGGGPNQYVTLSPAVDGSYRIRADAGVIPDPNGAHFNVTIQAVHGGDMFVTPAVISDTISPGTTITFTVGYSRTEMDTGIYDGQLFLGPLHAPGLMPVPITVYYNDPLPIPTRTPGPCRTRFLDLPADYWATPYITWLWCHGIVTGYADNNYRPGLNTTRVQFAKMLTLAQGWAQADPAAPTFTDVPPTFWGYPYVETLVAHGVVSGHPCGGPGEPCDSANRPYFRPVAPITRAQVVKMIVVAKAWLGPAATPVPTPGTDFSDVPPGHWAYPYVQAAMAHNVVSGYGPLFLPDGWATRAQLAKMVYQTMQQP